MANRSDEILNNVLDFAIEKYIQDGETKDGLLKKFKNNKMELVGFLREREFSKFAKEKPEVKSKSKKTAPKVEKEKSKPAPAPLVEKKKVNKKKQENKSEPTLF